MRIQAGYKLYAVWALPCLALWSASAMAQSSPGPAKAAVEQADAAFWEAYNRCDESAMAALFTADAEFYHDKTGLNSGRAQVAASMMRGPCSDPQKLRLRREAITDTIRFDPLAGGFALLSGEHRFLETKSGEPERPSGMARFTSIWQLSGTEWRMRRIVSYAHGPYLPKLIAVSTSAEALESLTGDYVGEGGATAQVRTASGSLTLASGGAVFNLVPIGPGRFEVADRAVQFRFNPDSLDVLENGATVANMRRVSAGR